MLTFTTGNMVSADHPSLGLDMAEQIRDDLALHSAWELVEEFAGSGDAYWYVFRCLATESDLPSNFHAIILRNIATGKLQFFVAEGYDSATNTISKYPTLSGTEIYDTEGYDPSTLVLDDVISGFIAGDPRGLEWDPTPNVTFSTNWWLIAADDGFTVAFNDTAVEFVHVGAYTSLSTLPIDMPLQIIGSSDNTGGIVSNPAIAGHDPTIDGLTTGLNILGGGGNGLNHGPPLGFEGSFEFPDALQGDQRPMAEQGIIIDGVVYGFEATLGGVLGKQKRMRVNRSAVPAAFAWGDSFEMNGTLWVPYKTDEGRLWDTGVAA